MRGMLPYPFGAMNTAPQGFYNPLSSYDPNQILRLDIQEMFFWYWRVNALRVQFDFTRVSDATSVTGDVIVRKQDVDPNGIDLSAIREFHLVEKPGILFIEDEPSPLRSVSIGLPATLISLQHNGNSYDAVTAWGPTFTDPTGIASFGVGIATQAFTAGTLTLTGVDLPLGRTYSSTYTLWTDFNDVSGTATISPAGFFTFNDEAGNPRYDPVTGGYVQ